MVLYTFYILELLIIVSLVILSFGYNARAKRKFLKSECMEHIRWRTYADFMMAVFFVILLYIISDSLNNLNKKILIWLGIGFLFVIISYLCCIKEAHSINKFGDEFSFGDSIEKMKR